jgi:TctA family transporter
MTSMIKADGSLAGFFSRPIAATLGAMMIATWAWMLLAQGRKRVA